MSHRLKTWSSRRKTIDDAMVKTVYAYPTTVNVYRRPATDSELRPGFKTEVQNLAYLRTITARLDPSRTTKYHFVGKTDDTDVKKGDRWEITQSDGQLVALRVVNADTSRRVSVLELKYE